MSTTINKTEWATSLREYLAEQRQAWPVPAREMLSWDQEFQCGIQGGSIETWLDKGGPRLIQERQMVNLQPGMDPNPLVIIRTDVGGIVAANAIVPPNSSDLIFCLDAEFAAFAEVFPDPDFLIHCEYKTTFDELVPAEAHKLRNTHDLTDEAHIAVHTECSTMGPSFVRCSRHLWDFSGDSPRLVEEAFESWLT